MGSQMMIFIVNQKWTRSLSRRAGLVKQRFRKNGRSKRQPWPPDWR